MRNSRFQTDAAAPLHPADAPVVATAVRTLQRQFGARRPVRAGSLILTIFGDAIAPRGGAITLGSLIRLAQPFGVRERLVRTSVSRLAQDGWLVAKRHGRRSEYRLTPEGEQRFAEATRRIYGRNPVHWDGHWTLLVLSPTGARERIREELRWLGFGRLAPTLFAHPSANLEQIRQWLKGLQLGPQVWLLKSTSEALAIDRELVARGWDLQELARGYRRFERTFEPIEYALRACAARSDRDGRPAQSEHSATWFNETRSPHSNTVLSADVSAQSAFVVRTLLIHEYRRIHLRDPMLPPILLPEGWIGSRAYELCRELYARVLPAAERHLSTMASRANDPLPAADPAVYGRFGGIPVA